MSENKQTFSAIKIGLASPEMIRSWSYGEVTKPETINYRTTKAEKDGLFCERIFGPTKDWECLCGKYKRVRYKGKICEKCGVEVTTKKVRRERMGHIELAAPVSHIWYFKAIPSRMGLLLDITPKVLESVLYYVNYIVIDPGNTPLEKKQALSENEYRKFYELYENDFKVGTGAEAIKELLAEIDIEELAVSLKEELVSATGQKKAKIIKRLEVVEAFRRSGNKPEWMVLDVIPVIPPEIRPMVQLDGGRYASSDLNDLYRRVINRNNRLKKLLELHAPEIIIRNEKRMLQEAVDALIDNGRRGKPVTGGSSNRPLKSLSEVLRGKQGRFRQNLLGKRVDYSGRSVIVVGPELKIYQCGLPKEMALELFKPFVMKRLVETGKATNIKDAKKKVDRVDPSVWDALEVVIHKHPVLLNRAPTLHRLSIQAFEPVLVEGRAIKLHPLVCTAFNADFDGDQMPVHVPLSAEAQAEAMQLMLSKGNLLKPADGRAVTVPSQDMVLGSYYLTMDKAGEAGEGHFFRDFDEAIMAYGNGDLGLHAPINVRVTLEIDGERKTGIRPAYIKKVTRDGKTETYPATRIEEQNDQDETVEYLANTTLGRLIFNRAIPQDLGYIDRTKNENDFVLEINFICGKSQLGDIINRTIRYHGVPDTAIMLDEIKALGYKYSTKASFSISIADVVIPPEKYTIIEQAEKDVDTIAMHYQMGELTENERYNNVIKIWENAQKDITEALQKSFDRYNPIKIMSDSGARGNMTQMRQLAGMRGLMFSATGRTMEIPIKANFREGLNILEYFIAARGARKSLSDTALRTADSGYLTRRLVDVSQDVIIREENCHTTDGMYVSAIKDGNDTIEKLSSRLVGRYTAEPVIDPATGEVIVDNDTMINNAQADRIDRAGITEVKIRTLLSCRCRHGVCAHCYGADMSSGKSVSIGESVGIVAAQSIGEPGTQLTMRTFHSGGVAASNITQGLPRVEEVFEARRPKNPAVIAESAGKVSIGNDKRTKIALVEAEDGSVTQYAIPYNYRLAVAEGDTVRKGQGLTEGYMSPQDILRISGLDAVYDYIIREVQKVYRLQSVEINDKHIEIIARQMTRKVKVEKQGDTQLLIGSVIDRTELDEANAAVQARIAAGEAGLEEAEVSPVLLGITKASLMTESFLSAASFQETTKVLTEAAIRGKTDNLMGLKENVIIGKLIPAGTGLTDYRGIVLPHDEDEDEDEDEAEGEAEAKAEVKADVETYGEDVYEDVDEIEDVDEDEDETEGEDRE